MITIWHHPRCSKSRQTLALLHEHGHSPVIRHYLDDAPNEEEIRDALAALDLSAIEMMRPQEPLFKEMGLNKTDADDVLIAAMARAPKLIERPIVFAGNRAMLGRPPEAVLELF